MLTDFKFPYALHFGIELKLAADPRLVMTKVLVRPTLPKDIAKYDKKEFEEDSLQKEAQR